jgi:putative DNA primase/helicase
MPEGGSMSQTKTPEDAARRAEQRARQAQAQYRKSDGNAAAFTSEQILAALKDNETGDARLLLAAMKARFIFDAKRQFFFRFDGGYWKKDLEAEALAHAGKILREAYNSEAARQYAIAANPEENEEAKKIAMHRHEKLNRRLDRVNSLHRQQNVLKLAATGLSGLVCSGDEWNADPWVIQAQDQIIDLKTGEHRPGLPGDFINKASPTRWKGLDEPAVAWCMFLHTIFNNDALLVKYIQRVLGAAMVGKPSQQEFYILWGEGRNGKGTILETLKDVLGEGLAGPIQSEMIMDTRNINGNGANPEVLDLQGKRIVWASETKEGQRLNAEKVKLFTGGDTLSSRYNYSNEMISFKPTHTLFMLTNNKPRISAGDTAVWDRLRLIPFFMRFVDNPTADNEREKDPDLQEKLVREASGILTWLVQGCLDWQKEGLNPPRVVTEQGREYRLDEDPVQQFINEKCIVNPGYKTQAQPLYDAFADWYAKTYGAKASIPSLKRFSERIRRNFRREEGRNTWFHGLGLAEENQF